MAATTTRSISSVVNMLKQRYPAYRFELAATSSWQPDTRTVFYSDTDPIDVILHETGHALLAHSEFARDIQLLDMERDAWATARTLADELAITLDESTITDHLDSYRDWLHDRSSCVNCTQTGIEVAKHRYRCLVCGTEWLVNDARQCGLKRTRVR